MDALEKILREEGCYVDKDDILEMILDHCFQEIDESRECAESYGYKHSKRDNEIFAKATISKWVEAARSAADELENRLSHV